MLTREQERENIFKTVEAITKLTGERPTGWSSPGVRSTDNTLELNLEAGLLYNCDFHDDEMPYPIKIGDKMLIMIPHQYTINDHRMQEEGTRHDFFEKFKDEFDYRYKIGPENPTMMNVITHGYLSRLSSTPRVTRTSGLPGVVISPLGRGSITRGND
jgi:peptidoglycan/xylan/chitin deacetylase (PgdA/CDA1 family)